MNAQGLDGAAIPLAQYGAVVDAFDGPAAIIDATAVLLHGNRWVEAPVGTPLLSDEADLAAGLCQGVDGSQRWRVRQIDASGVWLATSERSDVDHLLQRFFSGSDLLFVVYDRHGRIVETNDAWEKVLGYPAEDLVGVDSWSLVAVDDLVTRYAVEKELRETGRARPSWKMLAADGTQRVVQWSLRFDHRVGRCFAIGREAEAERRQADELHRRAYTDPLTGLANRTRLVAELDRAAVDGSTPAVLFCDLDGFKFVNDSLGHRSGDLLLEALGLRLNRLAQSGNHLVARIGGDEFVVVLRSASAGDAVDAAASVLTEVRRPFSIDGRTVKVGVSIGVAAVRQGEVFDPNELLRQADAAAYEAKRTGRNRFVVFGDELRAVNDRRFSTEAGLRHALQEDRIEVQLQPIVELPGRGVVGAEALMRWRDADGTLHSPAAFADVAEDAGLMPAIGAVVMRKALQAIADLHRAGRPILLSLNASGSELAAPGFVERLTDSISVAGADPSQVLVEVTEVTALADDVATVLAAVRLAGIRVGLDDFGTGHSSLWHLRRLPVDVLKIDRSFVSDLVTDKATRAITGAIVGICRQLGIEVIVEGIETIEHASAVEQVGASVVQGFLFHRPMPVPDFLHLLGADHSAAGLSLG